MSHTSDFDLSKLEAAVATISNAFFNDPIYIHIEPDEEKRMRVLDAEASMVVKLFYRAGLIDSTPDVKGVTLWLKPGNPDPSLAQMLQAGVLGVPFHSGFRSFFRLLRLDNFAREMHKKTAPGSHWYLGIAAVDPSLQGKGTGTALIKRGLARADADGLPCYLETSKERNVAFYEKFGFKVKNCSVVPNGDLRIWGMLREGPS